MALLSRLFAKKTSRKKRRRKTRPHEQGPVMDRDDIESLMRALEELFAAAGDRAQMAHDERYVWNKLSRLLRKMEPLIKPSVTTEEIADAGLSQTVLGVGEAAREAASHRELSREARARLLQLGAALDPAHKAAPITVKQTENITKL